MQQVLLILAYPRQAPLLVTSHQSRVHPFVPQWEHTAFRPKWQLRASMLDDEICDVWLDQNESGAPLRQLQIHFNCDEVNSEELSELLFEVGVLSVSVEGESERPEVLNDESKWSDLQKTKSWATALLRANFASSFDANGLREILQAAYPGMRFELTIEDVADKDWVTEVQRDWKPQVINDLTIRFPWHEDSLVITSKQLVLEGGAAFGTGDHPTTRLVCRWLAHCISGAKSGASVSVLDYGCGSGVLGLAALRYGGTDKIVRAVGVDIDKDALRSCANNCRLNDLHMDLYLANDVDNDDVANANTQAMSETQSVSMNTLRGFNDNFPNIASLDEKFDLLAANILAPILLYLAPQLAGRCKPGGKIALSGLVEKQTQKIIDCYSAFFDDLKVEETEEGWVVITGRRKGDDKDEEESDTWRNFLQERQERSV